MLKNIRFANFKSYVRAELPLAELTVLLGPNASGKSNALEALQILAWLASGQNLDGLLAPHGLDQITRGIPSAPSFRGAASDFAHAGSDVSFGCDLVDPTGRILRLDTTLRITDDGILLIGEELRRDDQEVPLYKFEDSVSPFYNEVWVTYNGFTVGEGARIRAIDQQAIFTQLTTPARFDAQHDRSQTEIPAAASLVQTTLERVLFLDPTPSRMRDYSFKIDHKKLRGDGSNLSAVVSHLIREKGKKPELLSFIESLPEQNIVDIGLIDGPRGEVMLELRETFGGRERAMSARLLSDGTLRVLAIGAALLSVPEGSVVVIEELDSGIHPSRARDLLQHIQSAVAARSLRVLLTTHNPALLDAIPDRAIPDVVVCYRDPADGDSRLVRLGDLEQYPEIVGQGPLGQIVTRGVMDRLIKHPTTIEERQRKLDRLFALLDRPP